MTRERQAKIVIVGIGNLLLSDEGVGVHAVRGLSQQELPPDVEVLDGGTSGADLVDHLEGRAKVIVIMPPTATARRERFTVARPAT